MSVLISSWPIVCAKIDEISRRKRQSNMCSTRIISTKSILTKSNLPVAAYSANPYVGCEHSCMYCYASFMKRFTNHPEEWGSFVDVKTWPEIRNPEKYSGVEIFIGSVTDPYQPLEEEYCRTRRLLEELKGHNVRISIATKSDLVLRDIDLIATFPNARVSWSINTIDESFRAEMDRAVSIERRLSAMREFHATGIRTTCFISPIFPGITDVPAIIERARDYCNLVWLENLNLRGNYRATVMNWIRERHPELSELYHEIYNAKNLSYWYELDEMMRDYCERNGLPYVRNDDSMERPFDAPPVVVNYFFHSEIVRHKK
ncbi:MAG: radical SAM mobile pair protein B [Synergistaceae bacterium]|nr:radical SAM mobile pair protein B [Synergistaceae bacterium]MBQ3397875.1 radical SAM mobile pair protein B [Synergistaceae bacterium]MBQ3759242.1 radical SAM mobile pair protein B [Synergistaceae bacterium]MBQ6114525.1 radical SAM mobile pair protein B [Synergistaceae bacterium]